MKVYDYKGKKNISGLRLREARVNKGLTQSDLAAQLQTHEINLEQNAISRTEKGTRFVPDYEIPVYAKLLNVSVAWLLGEED